MHMPYRVRRAFREATSPAAFWLGRRTANPALLRYGWDNDSYSADVNYLRALADFAHKSKGAIIECGSGVTTVLLELIAQKRNLPFVSLEHEEGWCKRTRERLSNPQALIHAPLRSYGEFDWYTLPFSLPAPASLVICDGPPATTRGGRYGALPLLKDHLADDAILLLDDAERPEEQAILKRWKSDFGVQVKIVANSAGNYAVVHTRAAAFVPPGKKSRAARASAG